MMELSKFVPVRNGQIALVSFFASVITSLTIVRLYVPPWLLMVAISSEAVCIVLVHVYDKAVQPPLQALLCSHGLGVTFTLGILMTTSEQCYSYFGYYIIALSFFHMSEYILTSIFNAHTLSIDSFLLNHSPEYCVAAVASWLEFWVEYYFFPHLKCIHVVCVIGAILVTGGEILRKLAMFTAVQTSHILFSFERSKAISW